MVCLYSDRNQYVSTYFLRNRPELELMCRLLKTKDRGSRVQISVLGCSKGAEIYSLVWRIRCARPDLNLSVNGVDISEEMVAFAEEGTYSAAGADASNVNSNTDATENGYVGKNTRKDQKTSIFERLSDREMQEMFESKDDQLTIRSWLRRDVVWICGDACDPDLAHSLRLQDIVVANRFLCHMKPSVAEPCLRNIARMVKPGGYLFVSGVDLDLRRRVAEVLGWEPVTDLIREIHEGDPSLRGGWPIEYWALEPFVRDRPDWVTRYASVFRLGMTEASSTLRTATDAPDSGRLIDSMV